ncbi:MAG: prepilin-type N-terminal cleavage/methylation domain-containing protein [Marinospirillum sp.]|uniref:prepilin-type N-terminal cleavage/methylation domain-containing protein n=1 Tax=Marinospirillum sp. TaxID=2183934 RepID=UPI001A05D7BF|nr:prepilin-type N-terminal cleavage/methylation domain-containing protein [Marinospirillum sp.]MBE0506551.1 prepilin-type N-terminal cleavage/methylation domain-containing protein [Marinospirillum sp.]
MLPIAPRNTLHGFTLMELLVSLLLISGMALMTSQYLLSSQRTLLLMQQRELAAATADHLVRQLAVDNSNNGAIQSSLASGKCKTSSQADLTLWCEALEKLPQLKAQLNAQRLILEWQSPSGLRQLERPRAKNTGGA